MAARTIKASEFKAKCLKLMDEVNETGDTLTITKNGKPVATMRGAEPKRRSLFGLHKGQIKIYGDLDEDTYPEFEKDWDEERNL